jgi:hypothetical protein
MIMPQFGGFVNERMRVEQFMAAAPGAAWRQLRASWVSCFAPLDLLDKYDLAHPDLLFVGLVFRPNHMIQRPGSVGWVEHRETLCNDRRRWVSLSLNPSYKSIALNHLNGSKH